MFMICFMHQTNARDSIALLSQVESLLPSLLNEPSMIGFAYTLELDLRENMGISCMIQCVYETPLLAFSSLSTVYLHCIIHSKVSLNLIKYRFKL